MVYLFLAFCLINLFNYDNATVNSIDIILVFCNVARLHWKYYSDGSKAFNVFFSYFNI